jgi:hypothetical protein
VTSAGLWIILGDVLEGSSAMSGSTSNGGTQESRPAHFSTAHTTGGRATREVGNSTLRESEM